MGLDLGREFELELANYRDYTAIALFDQDIDSKISATFYTNQSE
jgi:hypothetical protein